MKKYPLIGISICVVILLVLVSLTNVVGYQTIQLSNQQIIKEKINQKNLLFQTICDIINNREIQRIILKSQIVRGELLVSHIPVLTKNQLRQMYLLGLMLSKFIRTSRIQSMNGKYQFDNQVMQKEISTVIEKNSSLKREIEMLYYSECDCENDKTNNIWTFPVICMALYIVFWFFLVLYLFGIRIAEIFVESIGQIAYNINCFWTPFPS